MKVQIFIKHKIVITNLPQKTSAPILHTDDNVYVS